MIADKPFAALTYMALAALASNIEAANVGRVTPFGGRDYLTRFGIPFNALFGSLDGSVVMEIICKPVAALPN